MNFVSGRHAGLLIPLFSMPSRQSWGIGEIADLPLMGRWLASAGLDLLQLLPVNEMAGGQSSPYSAISAMAIDPIFTSVAAVEEFRELGGETAAAPEFRRRLDSVRRARTIDYQMVRELKNQALHAAFDRFQEAHWARRTARADDLRAYVHEQAWWLPDYALFRAIHERHRGAAWTAWEPALRGRDPGALSAMRRELGHEILFYEYLQWIADGQWRAARGGLDGVGLFGDFPFMVSLDSADVWARQEQFLIDASVGVPPDAFSETGQDWGLPVYRWDVHERDDFAWLRERARRSADLFDAYRVDHLVGFYRTYARPSREAEPYFTPAAEPDQLALGERLLRILSGAGPRIIAEDLGTVPGFVRESLARLGVPGFKVLRWEREWKTPRQPFRDPAAYPAVSVATSGTHDTDPMASWWRGADAEERAQVLRIPALRRLRIDKSGEYPPKLRDALLEALFASGSEFLILPVQDVFGWEDRINVPATVADDNWTYRLPWPIDDLPREPEARERANALKRWSVRHGRARRPGKA